MITCATARLNITVEPPFNPNPDRSIVRFRELISIAAATSATSTSTEDVHDIFSIIPHWRLGFSGPNGADLVRCLSNWNSALLATTKGLWTRTAPFDTNHIMHPAAPASKRIVGFISSWFCNSAVGRLMLGLVRDLDRNKFQVHVFHVTSITGKVWVHRSLSKC